MTEPTETEFKLRALRPIEVATVDAVLRELGLPIDRSDRRQHVDAYLDDADRSLAGAGIGLRLRCDDQRRRLTCKLRGSNSGGRFVREEHEADWTLDELPVLARDLPDPLRDLVEPFVRDRPLQSFLQLTTQRELRVVQHDGRHLGELVVDHVIATANQREATFAEVELEVLDDPDGSERLAHELSRRLPLQPATDDKPTHAMDLLGLLPSPPVAAPAAAAAPLADALVRLLRRHLTALQHAEAGVRSDRGPTALHSMRVEVRRLRCLVRAFRSIYPATVAPRLLERLGELGRQLGQARDLDVLLAEFASGHERLPPALQAGCEPARARAQDERDRAHAELRTWLRSATRAQAQAELEHMLLAPDPTAADAATSLGAAVGPRLVKAAATVRRLASELPPDQPLADLHALRIATKRLRYLAEEFANLPGHDYRGALRHAIAFQNAAGSVCDHEVALQRLVAWVSSTAATNGEALVAAALGGLAVDHARRARKARRAAAKALARLDRKKVWRQFTGGGNGSGEPDVNLAP